MQVRPYVLIALLDFLIDSNNESFRGKGTAASLKERVRADVQSEYPEGDVVLASILAVLEATKAEQPQKKMRTSLVSEKNATLGDGGRELTDGLADLRPHSVALDESAATSSDTHSRHKAALERYGTLDVKVQQKDKEVHQFHPKYISQALHFVAS